MAAVSVKRSIKSIFNGFLLKMLLRSLPVYILKQLLFSISVNSGRIFSVNILPLFTSISKNNCQISLTKFRTTKSIVCGIYNVNKWYRKFWPFGIKNRVKKASEDVIFALEKFHLFSHRKHHQSSSTVSSCFPYK